MEAANESVQDPSAEHPSLPYPLSPITRSYRKGLLITCLVTVSLEGLRISPSESTTLGLDIAKIPEAIRLGVLALFLAYFMINFTVESWIDLKKHKLAVKEYRKSLEQAVDTILSSPQPDGNYHDPTPKDFPVGDPIAISSMSKDDIERMAAGQGYNTSPSLETPTDMELFDRQITRMNWWRIQLGFILPIILGLFSACVIISAA